MKSSRLTPWLLVSAAIVVGVAIGGAAGVASARDADALVGGAMVMLGAMAGGVAGLLLGALAAWKLPARWIAPALWCLGVPAILILAFGIRGAWQIDQSTRDPDEAYAGLPRFVVVLERDPAHDPYLSPRIEVDAIRRHWITSLPDGRSCRGRLRAEVHRRFSEVLPEGNPPKECRDQAPSGSLERLMWQIEGAGSGAALLNAECLAVAPRYARLAHTLAIASSLADSAVSCD
ncbi:MAG: hypothetical protein AAF640_13520 [Pseudomonadota bacterium]